MFPHVHFEIFGSPVVLTSSNAFLVLAFLLALVTAPWALRKDFSALRSVLLVVLTTAAALIGGRLFHVFWERPAYFAQHPLEAVTRLDGLTFYGSLLAGAAAFAALIRRAPAQARDRAWDVAAITCAFLVGVLRISCFAEGCCWGTPTALPWAVRYYDPTSSMPWLGIPVHPVQLYESTTGFLIAAGLWALHRRFSRLSGQLIYVFCIAYALARFALERFRGDAYRGVDLVLGLSTSQLLSVAIGGIAAVILVYRLTRRAPRSLALGGLAAISAGRAS